MSIRASFQGWFGEFVLAVGARFSLPRHTYHALHNVTLLARDGTTQIDHLVVSRFGIFCIENKSMTGSIHGTANQPRWTQAFGRRAKHQFQNPLHQNMRHARVLEELLEIKTQSVISIVAFMARCNFGNEMPKNVVMGMPFEYIKSHQEIIFSDAEVKSLVSKIKALALPKNWFGLSTAETHATHLNSLKHRHSDHRATVDACPQCGSNLVVRRSRHSDANVSFVGCSAFPACRFTKQSQSS